jgi:Tol biopolymer transport system component
MANDTGGGVIHWGADNKIIFASEQDGWQHLYSLPVEGGTPKLLTPGNCEVEQWSFSSDGKTIFFNSNCNDIDRRHLWSVTTAGDAPQQLSNGQGIEWRPTPIPATDSVVYGLHSAHGSTVREASRRLSRHAATARSGNVASRFSRG